MKKIFFSAAVAMTMVIVGCNQDEINIDDDPVAVEISATIEKSVTSRMIDTDWDEGDAIGVFMGTGSTSPFTSNGIYKNIKYTIDGDGIFNGSTMIFKDKTTSTFFGAYYPYGETKGNTTTNALTIEVSTTADYQTPENQPKIDFLYDSATTTGSNPKVKFEFTHIMSKVSFTFNNGRGMDKDLYIKKYSISGLKLQGQFSIGPKSYSISIPNTVKAKDLEIELEDVLTNGRELRPLILIPQTGANPTKLHLEDNQGQHYETPLYFDTSTSTKLEAGKFYKFTITVNKTSVVIDKCIISDWVTEESETNASSADDPE